MRSESGRASPNANVLIELGYALRAIGDRRIIGVFNEALGSVEGLPFDLRRHRWPARYILREDTPADELIRQEFVNVLAKAVGAAAARADSDERGEDGPKDVGHFSFDASGRFKNGEIIAHVDASVPGANAAGQIVWSNRAQATIDLRPKNEIPTHSYHKLRGRAVQESFALAAFGPRKAQWYAQNVYGYVAGDVTAKPANPYALCITQLYKHSGALFGVNQSIVTAEDGGRQTMRWDSLREQFEATLTNYLRFYQLNPDYGDAFSLYVTLEHISGLHLREGGVPDGKSLGRIAENHIYHSQESISIDGDAAVALRPLFVKLWDSAGAVYHG